MHNTSSVYYSGFARIRVTAPTVNLSSLLLRRGEGSLHCREESDTPRGTRCAGWGKTSWGHLSDGRTPGWLRHCRCEPASCGTSFWAVWGGDVCGRGGCHGSQHIAKPGGRHLGKVALLRTKGVPLGHLFVPVSLGGSRRGKGD